MYKSQQFLRTDYILDKNLTGRYAYLMISRNMAQKHTNTANTDSTLDNSATDTNIAVIATNIIITSVEEHVPHKITPILKFKYYQK